MAPSRIRRSLQSLVYDYDNGVDKVPLEKLIRAWKHIQDLPFTDRNSFFVIGGYHGEPFHGAGASNSSDYWGGYCNHGNILFPTWHRTYLMRLENALRTAPGCADVTMPYWDEMAAYMPDAEVPNDPIPWVLTSKKFILDGNPVDNPLCSFTFPRPLDDAGDAKGRYNKPAQYTTVRFPLSGLVGDPDTKTKTDAYNATFDGQDLAKILNNNIKAWLNQGVEIPKRDDTARLADGYSLGQRYIKCLDAPNYMVFSNNSSAKQHIYDLGLDTTQDLHHVVSLESPHNGMHLAIGGFYQKAVYNANPGNYDANGDMGENNTAGLDPIFFFHHCFIDYVFWGWQKKHKLTKRGDLSVEWGYPGTNSSDGQAPAFTQANVAIDMDSPLYPFKADNGSWYTSNDVTDIIGQLNYDYEPGSIDSLLGDKKSRLGAEPASPLQTFVKTDGVNRANYGGSFLVRTYATTKEGVEYEIGREEVLSRWNIKGCQNCQLNLEVRSLTPLTEELAALLQGNGSPDDVKFHAEVVTHRGAADGSRLMAAAAAAAPPTTLAASRLR
jgi:tyrosinase